MSKFKDYINSDLSSFFNPDEFAEIHTIEGRELLVVVDNDRLSQRTQKEYEGIYVGDLLFFVSAADYGTRPKPGEVVRFDQVPYEVFDVKEGGGVYEIILKASES
ncbi:MAG: hypothetical protein QHH06_10330 [Clostridiales bacterium]|nr:hypothetical protein [Eubacteriales bacterium]MDH7566862.1 hypothetical protein [Clostridiales bacterium]